MNGSTQARALSTCCWYLILKSVCWANVISSCNYLPRSAGLSPRRCTFAQKYVLKLEPWQEPYAEGKVLLINKPLHWTSFDAVKKIRILTGISKVGHAGTLDPLATGLLIICTGKFTKKINEYMAREKEYTGHFTLGAVTPTYDLESEPTDQKPFAHLTPQDIRQAAARFTGDIEQVPPLHSAIKKDGKPAYLSARKGKELKLDPRKVHIPVFEIPRVELPIVHFRVVCSTGTYIRSLAYDMGQALGCGAFLSSLCRTRIGEFKLEDAVDMKTFEENLKQAKS
jgi:tRNA pseudouridine55 synthase